MAAIDVEAVNCDWVDMMQLLYQQDLLIYVKVYYGFELKRKSRYSFRHRETGIRP